MSGGRCHSPLSAARARAQPTGAYPQPRAFATAHAGVPAEHEAETASEGEADGDGADGGAADSVDRSNDAAADEPVGHRARRNFRVMRADLAPGAFGRPPALEDERGAGSGERRWATGGEASIVRAHDTRAEDEWRAAHAGRSSSVPRRADLGAARSDARALEAHAGHLRSLAVELTAALADTAALARAFRPSSCVVAPPSVPRTTSPTAYGHGAGRAGGPARSPPWRPGGAVSEHALSPPLAQRVAWPASAPRARAAWPAGRADAGITAGTTAIHTPPSRASPTCASGGLHTSRSSAGFSPVRRAPTSPPSAASADAARARSPAHVRLYERARERQDRIDRAHAQRVSEQAARELDGCTFSPDISATRRALGRASSPAASRRPPLPLDLSPRPREPAGDPEPPTSTRPASANSAALSAALTEEALPEGDARAGGQPWSSVNTPSPPTPTSRARAPTKSPAADTSANEVRAEQRRQGAVAFGRQRSQPRWQG